MKRLALLGASGHGKVVGDIAFSIGWNEVLFFDDAWPALRSVGHWPVIGDTREMLASLGHFEGVLVSIGNCRIRWIKQQQLAEAGASLVSLIHPRAVLSSFCSVGPGSVVMAGAVVNIDARLGRASIVNTGATVDHDCAIGDAVHIAPGANLSGSVNVGDRTWIGVGAVVRQGLSLGSDVMVGAGAVVVHDQPDGVTVVGNPAKVRR